ncbi:hypothetical protein JD76_02202 [Micromonospora endolithica]|nr:hypothetical protein JD76_02202 [Micromonospora endolithica]
MTVQLDADGRAGLQFRRITRRDVGCGVFVGFGGVVGGTPVAECRPGRGRYTMRTIE